MRSRRKSISALANMDPECIAQANMLFCQVNCSEVSVIHGGGACSLSDFVLENKLCQAYMIGSLEIKP